MNIIQNPIPVFILLIMAIIPNSVLGEENIPIPVPSDRKNIKVDKTKKKPETKARIYQSACPSILSGQVTAKSLPPIKKGQCAELSPIEVSSILGIELTPKAVLNCRMAVSLVDWVEKTKIATKLILKDELKSINTSSSYQCRKRRGGSGSKLSEHSFANALDISGFTLRQNTTISVLDDWEKSPAQDSGNAKADFLSSIRTQACELFTTVLSPDSNEDHKDHFHFDLGCHGKTCTYKICE